MPSFKCPVCEHVTSVAEGQDSFNCSSCEANLQTKDCVPADAAEPPVIAHNAAGQAPAANPYAAPQSRPPPGPPSVLESWFWGPLNGIVGGATGMLIASLWAIATLMFGQWQMLLLPALLFGISTISVLRGVMATQRRMKHGETFRDQVKLDLSRWGIQLALAGIVLFFALAMGGTVIFTMLRLQNQLEEDIQLQEELEW